MSLPPAGSVSPLVDAAGEVVRQTAAPRDLDLLGDLEEVIRAGIVGVRGFPPRISQAARRVAQSVCRHAPGLVNQSGRDALAEFGIRMSRLLNVGHSQCEGIDPSLPARTLALALQISIGTTPASVGSASCPANDDPRDAEVVAIWALSGVAIRGQAAETMTSSTTAPSARAQQFEGSSRRWAGFFASDRLKDLNRLGSEFPGGNTAIAGLLPMFNDSPAEDGWVLDALQDRAPDTPCLCGEAELLCSLATDAAHPAPWRTDPPGAEQLLQAIVARADPRVDIYRGAGRLLVINPVAAFDSLLVATIGLAGDVAATKWHEGQLEAAVRGQLPRACVGQAVVRKNVSWRRSSHANQPREGEIDCVALVDGFLFDFQAKAPSTPNPRRRIARLASSAREQHTDLADALANSVALLDHRGNEWRSVRKPIHVPISVGVEEGRSWIVGPEDGSQASHVVSTTLDHLRIVNRLVPSPWRPIYWLDRWLMQHQSLRFVSELSYLDFWWGRTGHSPRPACAIGNLVMAERELVEAWLYVDNARALSRGGRASSLPAAAREAKREAEAAAGLDELPRVTRLATQLARDGMPGWLGVLTTLRYIGLATVERVLSGSTNKQFSVPWGSLSFALTSSLPQHARTSSGDPSRRILTPSQNGWLIAADAPFTREDLLTMADHIAGKRMDPTDSRVSPPEGLIQA